MKTILNLTQHVATPEQAAQGVVEPEGKEAVKSLLTFPTYEAAAPHMLEVSAAALVRIAIEGGHTAVMIGGMPALMPVLQRALQVAGIEVLYAFSARESVEKVNEAGEVVKTSRFVHKGFHRAPVGPEISWLRAEREASKQEMADLARQMDSLKGE